MARQTCRLLDLDFTSAMVCARLRPSNSGLENYELFNENPTLAAKTCLSRQKLATAKLFVKEGAYVFITGRRQKELDQAVKAIGANVSGVQGDVAQLADLDRLYETISNVKGRIDVVFANAGVGEFVPFGAVTEEHFDKLFSINGGERCSRSKRPYRY